MTKFTLMQLASHDFARALRIWRKFIPLEKIITLLFEQQAKSLKMATRYFAVAALGAIWLTAHKTSLVVDLPVVEDLSIPTIYVFFVVAIAFAASLISIANYVVLEGLLMTALDRLFGFNNLSAMRVLHSADSSWSLGLQVQYRFFKSGKAHGYVTFAVLTLCLPLLAVIGAVYWTVFTTGIEIFKSAELFTIPWLIVAAAIFSIILPVILLMLYLLPFKFEKNTSFIRWNFLRRLHRINGSKPPRLKEWLDEDVKNIDS